MSEINRQLANSAAVSYRNQASNKALRRARTRTIIQAGSLLPMLGFFSLCGIEEGLDLQLDLESRDKAAVLLGILSDAFDRLPVNPDSEQLEQWKKVGVRIMKMRNSKPSL